MLAWPRSRSGSTATIWHTIFGLESDIDALLSPTHLLMAVSLLAIVSAPWRAHPPAVPRQRWRTDGTRVVSLLLATLVVGFFLPYLWIPAFAIGSVDHEQWLAGFGAPPFVDEVSQIAVLAASLMLTALVVVPVLLATRGGRPPAGALLAVIAFTAVAITAIREFSNGQSLAAFLAAGLLAEGLAALRTSPRRRAQLLGGLVPAVLWTVYWITFALVYDLGWGDRAVRRPGRVRHACRTRSGCADGPAVADARQRRVARRC